jgi:hypothetical protein
MTPNADEGVDIMLIRRMLSLAPAERLEELQMFVDFVRGVRSRNATEPDIGGFRNAG